MWYTQPDGLAMGALLAVILANLRMKTFEKSLQKSNEGRENKTPELKVRCFDFNRRVTHRGNESSANQANIGFMQNAKVSLTRSRRTCRKFDGSTPIVHKKLRHRTHRN